MITRFRIEAEHNTQEDVVSELSLVVSRVIGTLKQDDAGTWECTQDVTVKTDTGYKGRMVMKFNFDEEDWDEAES